MTLQNPFSQKNSVADSARDIMEASQKRRNAEATAAKDMGVYSARALPHERMNEYNERVNKTLTEEKQLVMHTKKGLLLNNGVKIPISTSGSVNRAGKSDSLSVNPTKPVDMTPARPLNSQSIRDAFKRKMQTRGQDSGYADRKTIPPSQNPVAQRAERDRAARANKATTDRLTGLAKSLGKKPEPRKYTATAPMIDRTGAGSVPRKPSPGTDRQMPNVRTPKTNSPNIHTARKNPSPAPVKTGTGKPPIPKQRPALPPTPTPRPTNAGPRPEPKKQSFGSAFAAARKSGLKAFTWNGRKFNTKLKGQK